MTDKLLAWHFSAADKRLGYDDGRLIRKGRTLKTKGEPVLCHNGLHASVRLMDALQYSPGPYLWRVELGGTIIRGTDKVVATERKALYGFDATDMLRKFARLCALDVIHLWDAPDVVRQFLQTGDESLWDAARDAAWDARAAAGAAAWAARAAAWGARDAARDATWAAWDAAMAAAQDAAWNAAMAAARDAARDAAWDAAMDRQESILSALVKEYSGEMP